jgi:hypothetical protein
MTARDPTDSRHGALSLAIISTSSSKDFPIKSFPLIGIGDTSLIRNFEKVISFCYYDIGILPVESKFQMIPLENKFCFTRESISIGCSGGPVFDEYENIEGLIPISEIATGWIKYIRDHIREGQKVVCKVLHVDKTAGISISP